LIGRLQNQPKLKQYIEHTVVEIKGEKSVTGILVESSRDKRRFEIPVRGVFIEIGLVPNTEIVDQAVEKNEAGEIQVDCFCRTNLPGLYAAGDATSVPEKQIIVAAGEGAKAAIITWEDLLKSPPGAVKQ
jgi:alkyl hydroperoxide reductase subunit F